MPRTRRRSFSRAPPPVLQEHVMGSIGLLQSQMARDTALLVSENLKETRALRNREKGRQH